MLGYRGTKRRHRKRRGGLDKQSEDSFLKEQARKRREELEDLGDRLRKPPQVVEGVGTGQRAFDPKEPGHVATEHASISARAQAAGKRRRHSRRKTHRRRR